MITCPVCDKFVGKLDEHRNPDGTYSCEPGREDAVDSSTSVGHEMGMDTAFHMLTGGPDYPYGGSGPGADELGDHVYGGPTKR